MSKKTILGILCGYSHDSGIALIRDGKILWCLSEERVSRVKKDAGFPELSIKAMSDYLQIPCSDIDEVVLGAKDIRYMPRHIAEQYFETGISYFNHACKKNLLDRIAYWVNSRFARDRFSPVLRKKLIELGFRSDVSIHYVDHHAAHCASVFHTSGLYEDRETYVVVMDAYGDSKAVSAHHALKGERIPHCFYKDAAYHSTPGQAYGQVTKFLGMKVNRHEGKVTGLAASGKVFDPDSYRGLIRFDENKTTFRRSEPLIKKVIRRLKGLNYYSWIFKRYFEGLRREDVASITQRVFENEIEKFLKGIIPAGFSGNLFLNGGVFANVCLNYRVGRLFPLAPIYIHPGMSDEGIALGAALHRLAEIRSFPKIQLRDVYLGRSYEKDEVLAAVQEAGLGGYKVVTRTEGYEKLIAELIDFGAVVGLFDGRMEYGPRALGNRTILIQPRDKSINDEVNHRLNRSEFMPFAPVVLEQKAGEVFEIPDNLRIPLRYMTTIVNVREEWRERLAGVTHVDGTARPQTIDRETNAFYYDIVSEFFGITGIPVLVNTSFNLHEEPMVEHPGQALQVLENGSVDAVCFKDCLLVHENYWDLFQEKYAPKDCLKFGAKFSI